MTNTACYHFYVEPKKTEQTSDYNEKGAGSQIQRQTRDYPWGGGDGEGAAAERDSERKILCTK